ncbi:hypothetical protein D3C80_1717110 [compost metagenome]
MQLAAGADTVGRIAPVDMTEVHGRVGHGKGRVVKALLQRFAQLHQAADGFMHQIDGVHAARRVTRVAGLADDADGVGYVALVRTHRLQRGWLTDNGEVRTDAGRGGKITCAGHRRFFICGGQNV